MLLHSQLLQFSRDGKLIACADDKGVTLASVDGDLARIEQRAVVAIATFANQIWTLDEQRAELGRFRLDGSVLAPPRELAIAPCAGWLVVPASTPGVLAQGNGRLALIEEDDDLVEISVAAHGVAFPLAAHRHVVCHDGVVYFGGGVSPRLEEDTTPVAGAAVLGGTSAVLVVNDRHGGRGAIMFSTETGRVQSRFELPPGEMRIAAERGMLVVQRAERCFAIVDLRSGRVQSHVDTAVDVEDFAVDPAAQRIALRAGDAVAVHALGELSASSEPELRLAIHGPRRRAAVFVGATPSAPPLPSCASLPTTGDSPLAVTGTAAHAGDDAAADTFELRGFGPAPPKVTVTRHEAARLLRAELQWVGLRALLAIAHGWDSGRIAFANESCHPQELEATAIVGINVGQARDHVEQAQARLREHERVLASDPARRSRSTPLGALADELSLSPLAIDILLVVAAPALWGEASRLYAILGNDPTRALVDELLVQQILADTDEARSDIAHELDAGAPLRDLGLIHVAPQRQRPFAALSVDPVVLARLRGERVALGRGEATTVRAADRTLSELLVPAQLVREAVRYLSREPTRERLARIALRGPVGSGRRTLLAALAAKAGREVGVVDLARLPREADAFAEALRTELRRAHLRGLVPCIVGLDEISIGHEDPVRAVVRDVLRTHTGPAAVHLAPRAKVPLDPGYLLLELPTPSETDRLRIWRDALATCGLAGADPEVLATRYRVGPGTIWSVVRAVADDRSEDGRVGSDVVADIEARMRQTREVRLGEHARRVERLATWSSLVLPEETLYSLRELVGRARHRKIVYEQWGFDELLSTARGLTALFEGPPGTGKTLVAGVIARELGLDLYQIDLSKVMSKWIGETEKNLGAIFDAAEDGQVMLLFDEADSLFSKRSEVKSSNDRFANLEVNYLLQRLDAFEGFAILTTNFGTSIDPAFKRRLSFRLVFPFPDEQMRADLWRVHLPAKLPIAGRLDLDALASRYKLSGGYIRNACVRAAFLAAEEGSALTHAHLERAVELEFAEVGKLSTSGRIE